MNGSWVDRVKKVKKMEEIFVTAIQLRPNGKIYFIWTGIKGEVPNPIRVGSAWHQKNVPGMNELFEAHAVALQDLTRELTLLNLRPALWPNTSPTEENYCALTFEGFNLQKIELADGLRVGVPDPLWER